MLKFSLGTARYCLSVGWIIILEKSQTTLISRYFTTNSTDQAGSLRQNFMILLYATNGSACTSMPSKDVVGTNQ